MTWGTPDYTADMGGGRSIRFFRRPNPDVRLIELTDPTVVGMATRGYAGLYSSDITQEEFDRYWAELDLTKLKTPLEMVHVTVLLLGVTRSFTHQLVRYRLGTSFVQESMRFSVQDSAGILVPSGSEEQVSAFEWRAKQAMRNYWRMLDEGAPTEDARALLPHAVTTNIFCQFSLLALANIYTQRTCCQAQHGEWGIVMSRIRRLVAERSEKCASVLRAPWETGATTCGFGASFDRPCIHQAAFDRNAERMAMRLFTNSKEVSA